MQVGELTIHTPEALQKAILGAVARHVPLCRELGPFTKLIYTGGVDGSLCNGISVRNAIVEHKKGVSEFIFVKPLRVTLDELDTAGVRYELKREL